MKKLLLLLFLFISSFTYGQVFTQTFVDRCTSEVKVVTANFTSGSATVAFYSRIRTFTYQEFLSGQLNAWLIETYAWYNSLSPCSTTTQQAQQAQQQAQQAQDAANQAAAAAAAAAEASAAAAAAEAAAAAASEASAAAEAAAAASAAAEAATAAASAPPPATATTGTTQNTTTNTGSTQSNTGSTNTTNTSGGTNDTSNTSSTNNSSSGGDTSSTGGDTSSTGGGDSSSSGSTEGGTETGSSTEGSSEGSSSGETTDSSTEGGTESSEGNTESTEGSSESTEETKSEEVKEEKTEETKEETKEESKEEAKEEEKKEEEKTEEKEEESSEEEKEEEKSTEEEVEEEEKKEKVKMMPIQLKADAMAMQTPFGDYNAVMNIGASQSSVFGDVSYSLNGMVWDNLKQVSFMGGRTKIVFDDSYQVKLIKATSVGYANNYSISTLSLSQSFMKPFKNGLTVGVGITAGTTFESYPIKENFMLSYNILATKSFKITDRITYSPALIFAQTPFTSTKDGVDFDFNNGKPFGLKLDNTLEGSRIHFMGIMANSFTVQLTKRFSFNVGWTIIKGSDPNLPMMHSFMIGSKLPF